MYINYDRPKCHATFQACIHLNNGTNHAQCKDSHYMELLNALQYIMCVHFLFSTATLIPTITGIQVRITA